MSRVCAGDGSHLEKRSCGGNSVGNGENRWVEAWNASINSCFGRVSQATLYIRMCEGLEKKEKLARTSNTV